MGIRLYYFEQTIKEVTEVIKIIIKYYPNVLIKLYTVFFFLQISNAR